MKKKRMRDAFEFVVIKPADRDMPESAYLAMLELVLPGARELALSSDQPADTSEAVKNSTTCG